MINQEFTFESKIAEMRAHQKEWQQRCKAKGIDMTWKAHVNKKRPLIFVPMNSYKNSKSAWLEDHM